MCSPCAGQNAGLPPHPPLLFLMGPSGLNRSRRRRRLSSCNSYCPTSSSLAWQSMAFDRPIRLRSWRPN